jgi:hypothetical protein
MHLEPFAGPSPKITRRDDEQALAILGKGASSSDHEVARQPKKCRVIATQYDQQRQKRKSAAAQAQSEAKRKQAAEQYANKTRQKE